MALTGVLVRSLKATMPLRERRGSNLGWFRITESQVGKPLYTFAADTAPGETKGDGVGGTWHVAKPA